VVIRYNCRGYLLEHLGDGMRLDCQPHDLAALHYFSVALCCSDAMSLTIKIFGIVVARYSN